MVGGVLCRLVSVCLVVCGMTSRDLHELRRRNPYLHSELALVNLERTLTGCRFTSDYIGLPPSIDDATFSLQLPKDEEEDAYFRLKCRYVQLFIL